MKMNHCGTVELETERLLLRRFTLDDANNPNSGKVMEKVGMKKEGVLRQAGRNNQGVFDLVMYSILREEFCA